MRIEDEKGQALPLALVALAMGALVVTPFLTHVGTGLTGSRIYGLAIMGQYSCDAGVEHAMWNLTNGGLAEQLPDVGDSVTYQLSETINGATTSITVTVDEVSGEVFGGIVDEIIYTLEFDTSDGYEPDIVHLSGSIYGIPESVKI